MVKTVLLDCGGVMAKPASGNWLFPRNFHALMDNYLSNVSDEQHTKARNTAVDLLNADHHLYTEDVEAEQMLAYFRNCYCRFLGLPIPERTLEALALAEVYDDERFAFYDDVLPVLRSWQGKYRLGLVSDTHPGLRRAMRNHGSLQLFDAASLSCENGVFKPHPMMYEKAMQALGAEPATTIFVDDLDKNLRGAEELGIRAVKMVRNEYTDDPISSENHWKGTSVRSLAELDAILENL